METPTARRPAIALLLSLITPGLGQIYNGQLKRGIILYLGCALLGPIFLLAGLFFTFYGMLISLAIILALWLFVGFDAFIRAAKSKAITPKPYNKWYLYLMVFLVSTFVIQPFVGSSIKNNIASSFKIPSSGMEPALQVGDYLVADMRIYKSTKPNRGDIIIFEFPKDPSKDFIKRVIGLGDEKVEIIGDKIYINDKLLDDPWGYFDSREWLKGFPERFGPVTVPKGSLFVLGDNRNNSQDSRFWGFVDIKKVKGKAIYIYWAKNKNRIGMQIK
jgi:signal peptidase I